MIFTLNNHNAAAMMLRDLGTWQTGEIRQTTERQINSQRCGFLPENFDIPCEALRQVFSANQFKKGAVWVSVGNNNRCV